MKKELILITGTDSGIGYSLARLFSEKGYSVLATYLESTSLKGVMKIKLDLRKEKQISNINNKVKQLIKKGFTLKCMINNAGIALGGPVENTPMKIYRENFEVNYFGLVSLTQKMIPHLIKSKGTIMIIGSAAGRIAMPFLSPYVSTKFALEGFSDCLRRELTPYNIKTILIEPAAVATPIWDKAKKQDISFIEKKYMKSIEAFRKDFIEAGNKGISPDTAAEKIFRAFRAKNPKPRYVVARSPMMDFYIPRLLPAKTLDNILIKKFEIGKK